MVWMDKPFWNGERRVDCGRVEIAASQKSNKSFERSLVAGQFLHGLEVDEYKPLRVSPDIRNPNVAPAAARAPHLVIAAEIDAEESAHAPSTISRSMVPKGGLDRNILGGPRHRPLRRGFGLTRSPSHRGHS
jgi:hypothetical protein